jgi:acyl-CoA thioesterase FadM
VPLVLGLRYPLAGIRSLLKPRAGVYEWTSVHMRVRISDCDSYLHVNNGRYLSLMDIGRINHAGRCGMIGLWRRTGWKPVAGGATIRFRRELRIGTRYTLRTRCAGFDEGWSYWEQVFERADGKLAARAFAKVAMLDRDGTRLKSERVIEALGLDPADAPPLPDAVASWQASEYG